MCVQNTPASLHHKIFVKKGKKKGTSVPFRSATTSYRRFSLGAMCAPRPSGGLPSSAPQTTLSSPHAKTPWPLPPPSLPAARTALLGARRGLSGLHGNERPRGRRKRRTSAEVQTPRKRQSTRPKAPIADEKRQMKRFKEDKTKDTPQTAQEQETLSFPGGSSHKDLRPTTGTRQSSHSRATPAPTDSLFDEAKQRRPVYWYWARFA